MFHVHNRHATDNDQNMVEVTQMFAQCVCTCLQTQSMMAHMSSIAIDCPWGKWDIQLSWLVNKGLVTVLPVHPIPKSTKDTMRHQRVCMMHDVTQYNSVVPVHPIPQSTKDTRRHQRVSMMSLNKTSHPTYPSIPSFSPQTTS